MDHGQPREFWASPRPSNPEQDSVFVEGGVTVLYCADEEGDLRSSWASCVGVFGFILVRWVLTVASEMNSRKPASRLESNRSQVRNTSTSRALSCGFINEFSGADLTVGTPRAG